MEGLKGLVNEGRGWRGGGGVEEGGGVEGHAVTSNRTESSIAILY